MKMRWIGHQTSHALHDLTLEPQQIYDITMHRMASHLLVVEARDEEGKSIRLRYKGTLPMKSDWRRVRGALK